MPTTLRQRAAGHGEPWLGSCSGRDTGQVPEGIPGDWFGTQLTIRSLSWTSRLTSVAKSLWLYYCLKERYQNGLRAEGPVALIAR